MTEQEWLECGNLPPMLTFVRPNATLHKMLAFASAFDRLLPQRPESEQSRRNWIVEAAAPHDPIAKVWDNDHLVSFLLSEVLRRTRREMCRGGSLSPGRPQDWMRTSCDLLRDVFAPFQSVTVDRGWLLANDGAARKIATVVYNEQGFGHLPILADALEEAGCDNADILAHLRSPGPHVRGCWVVDVLTGRG
jgi:hypothetical protein